MVRGRGPWLALLAVLGALIVWWLQGGSTPRATAPPPAGRRAARAPQLLPRIDLSRLAAPRDEARVGQRDLFAFGSASELAEEDEEPGEPVPPPTVTPVAANAGGLPPAPLLNLKFIGSLDNGQGIQVAVLLTDGKEVLWGQAGTLVGNRFRIVKIGLESVDIQELGSDRVRRVPLRGN